MPEIGSRPTQGTLAWTFPVMTFKERTLLEGFLSLTTVVFPWNIGGGETLARGRAPTAYCSWSHTWNIQDQFELFGIIHTELSSMWTWYHVNCLDRFVQKMKCLLSKISLLDSFHPSALGSFSINFLLDLKFNFNSAVVENDHSLTISPFFVCFLNFFTVLKYNNQVILLKT